MEEKFLKDMLEHQALIHKICRLYRDTHEDREDLFQEIVYQLWKSYPKFQNKSKVSSWMYRIGLNTAMATFRKPRIVLSGSNQVPENTAIQNTNSEESREELLFNVVKKLDDAERAMIALYLEDISYAEIAGILGISESNVGVRLNRIKKKIRILLNS
jgi:RNA polymerase sigma-70 factor (ECF subfamily)